MMRKKSMAARSRKSVSRPVSGDLASEGSDPSFKEELSDENAKANMSPSWYGLPVEELDPLIFDNTFCAVTKKFKRHYIYRYSASKSLFLFGPVNPIRKVAIYVTTNRYFESLITLAILLNCITMSLHRYQFDSNDKLKPMHLEYVWDWVELGFSCLYVTEVLLKIIAKGFIFNKFAYLRSKWNILDFSVVTFAVFMFAFRKIAPDRISDVKELTFLMTLRAIRAVKALVIFPGVKLMLKALVSSVIHLVDVLVLIVTCVLLFSVLALQVFQGRLQQKCVIDKGGVMDPNAIINVPLQNIQNDDERNMRWTEWVSDWENWKTRDFPQKEPTQCGNQSTGRLCGEGYTCIGQLGHNPEHGWIHFDNIGTALLTTFQLMTTDFWERVYDLVVSTNGIWSVPFFVTVIFMGFYYLLNLLLAVVIMSYENEVILKEKGPTAAAEQLRLRRRQSTFSFDHFSKLNVCKLTHATHRTKSEMKILKERAKKLERAHERQSGQLDYAKDIATGDANNPKFDEFVMRLVGIREALASEEMEEEDNRRGSNASLKRGVESSKMVAKFLPTDLSLSATNETNHVQYSSDLMIPFMDLPKIRSKRRHTRNRFCRKNCAVYERYLTPVVEHKAFEWTITVCILLNTIVLTLDYHNPPKELEDFTFNSNIVFMIIFTVEVILKALALQKKYFKNRWNQFDLAVVIISYVDFVLEMLTNLFKVQEFTVFRAIRCLRLLRVFKLAHSWVTLKVLLNIIFATLADLINLTVVLLIVLYFFAILGMALVAEDYTPGAFGATNNPMEFPSWRWEDFGYSFMMVFRVLCGEWIEPLLQCLQAQNHKNTLGNYPVARSAWNHGKCFFVYFLILIVGNFILFNLFLALLLNRFDLEELNTQKQKEREENAKNEKMKNIIGLITRQQEIENQFEGTEEDEIHERTPSPQGFSTITLNVPTETRAKLRFRWAVHRVIVKRRIKAATRAIARCQNQRTNLAQKFFLKNPVGSSTDTFTHDTTPESSNSDMGGRADCCPVRPWMLKCYRRCRRRSAGIIRRKQRRPNAWTHFREFCYLIVTNRYFDWLMFLMIVGSSILLCFEDNTLKNNPPTRYIICTLNYVFTVIFVAEMILKCFALGLYRYWTNFWTILDGGLVVISLINGGLEIYTWKCSIGDSKESEYGFLIMFRALRALRPLRAVSRMEGMKVIVSSLVHAIPAIFNVMLVCLVFWLVFAVFAVQLFKGKFYRCVNKDGSPVDHRLVPNKGACCAKDDTHEYSWINMISNYDHVGMAYLSLFQVATFEGWMELISASVNSVDVDIQPKVDYQFSYYIFYVAFIIFGSFFTLKLFITVIIDNFNMLKKKFEGNILELLLTPSQRNYYIAMKSMGMKKPKKLVRGPKSLLRNHFYYLAFSKRLEAFIVTTIFLNVVMQMFDDHNRPLRYVHMISGIKGVFATLYALEVVVKILGLGSHYFVIPWNVFDFIISLCSLLEAFYAIQTDVILPIPPASLRIVRILHVGRLMHGAKWLSGIRKLLFALTSSLPALLNVGALLILVTFMYAILGMGLFMDTPRKWSIDSVFNFETFQGSCLMLLRLMTVAGWNEVLDSLSNVKPECGPYRHLKCGYDGEPKCPQPWIVIPYLVSYLLLTNQITMNLFCAIILENFVEACDEQELGIVENDLEIFYLVWSRYDHYATQFIHIDELSDFLDDLSPPFQVPKPNTTAIVMFNLPIARGGKIHCLDILHALIKHILGKVDDSMEFRHLQRRMEAKFRKLFPNRGFLDIVSDTQRWKIEMNAVIRIQRAWRRKRARMHPDLYELEKPESVENFPVPKGANQGGFGHMAQRMTTKALIRTKYRLN